MPVKLMEDGTAKFYYKNEDGTYTEINDILPITGTDDNYHPMSSWHLASEPGREYTFGIKYSWSVKRIMKEHKHWVNCIDRAIRREKRQKELARRSILKWRALHS